MSKRTKKVFLSLLCFILLVLGCKFYMDRMKVDNLYRHGFQLYEEQIATYLKENYSGISKIEFSPIFKSGGSGEGFVYARIVPVVYDTYGNKVYLRNDGVLKMGVADYEMTAGIDLDFNVNDGSEIIYLRNDQKESIGVESYQNLPDELKLNKDEITDEVMEAFSREGHLKGVEKNDQGSPRTEIVYNLEIRRVQGREFYEWK
ncbi:hypothetical protein [Streptococcus australis]|uniref:hypothetical protein n=1 Tax=Streptococcus australis TaxID=113107 RepID=UPI00232EC91E|nr:hypothetical protein [Streptococcus australis]MDB8642726.1 hypothetical protein [Streptococcus australis]MDB8645920.1 hypothetical protein [Streptococcus australis]